MINFETRHFDEGKPSMQIACSAVAHTHAKKPPVYISMAIVFTVNPVWPSEELRPLSPPPQRQARDGCAPSPLPFARL